MIGGVRGGIGLYNRQQVLLRAALSSEVLWWSGNPYDLHLGEMSLTGLGARAPGVSVAASGSVTSGFSEITPTLTGRLRAGSHSLHLRAGPALRISTQTATGTAPGGSATALWAFNISPSLSTWAHLDGDFWPNSMLPERVVGGDLGMRWRPTPPLALSGSAGLSMTGGENLTWVAGLPPGGSRIFRGRLTVDCRLSPYLGIRGELIGDRGYGALDYGHARLTAGLTAQRSRLRGPPSHPATRWFTVEAPEATAVSLLGSFSDWKPVPMLRDKSGTWRAELDLPVGVYEYIYLIDGQPLLPPEAERYQDDGFGGRNGVLIVGE